MLKSSDKMVITIFNLNGQEVFHKDLGILTHGENNIVLNLSKLENGIYTCQLTSNGSSIATHKLVISH